MFTGIVEHVGTVQDLAFINNGWTLTISNAAPVLTDCHLGDSICINGTNTFSCSSHLGTCLTVTEFTDDTFKVGLAPETLKRTNLGQLSPAKTVNLERAMLPSTRFGGHYVQGHVDTTCKILSKEPLGDSIVIRFQTPREYLRYIIPKGYVTLDGTSLTVIDVNDQECWFSIMMIAYTQTHVIMPSKEAGEFVNLEVDMISKYVERSLIYAKAYTE
jgi:riboflavin synthase